MSLINSMETDVSSLAEQFSISDAKAFTLWCAKILFELDDMDAFDALSMEGPNDKGIDLFWVDQINKRVVLAQTKYSKSGKSNPKIKQVRTFINCINWISNPQALENEGKPELVALATDYVEAVDSGYKVELWFIYSGEKNQNIDKELRVYNANPENRQRNRSAIHCDINLIETSFEEYRGINKRIEHANIAFEGIPLEVTGTFGRGMVATISAKQLVDLYENFGDRLFDRNVRMWLGARRGSVNAGIISTVEDEKEKKNFWAYNNGITIVCDNYEYDGENNEVTLSNLSIVNGCQTTVSLSLAETDDKEQVTLLARIISPPNFIIDSIIQYTNSQNPIRSWDMVSQSPIQIRLKKEFESMKLPYFYAIRRGEWKSLNAHEKRTFKNSVSSGWRIIKHDLLAQYLASFKGRVVVAYKNKAFLFDQLYNETFPPDIRVEEALFVWHAGEITQALVKREIKQESQQINIGESIHEKYVLILKRGGRFFSLGVCGLLTELRNGPDFLRTITEERITSKSAQDRITKYAELSIVWYKQAVSDIISNSNKDISVLIRDKYYFDKVKERIINMYEAYKVNKDWIEGALPKLK